MTTPANPDDLTSWLRAQLDDDERVATNNGKLRGDEWSALEISPARASWEVVRRGSGVVADATQWEAEHIARHDPARVLAEVDAKRRILDEAERYSPELEHGDNGEWAFDAVLRLLALPFADREGFREEWRA